MGYVGKIHVDGDYNKELGRVTLFVPYCVAYCKKVRK